MTLETVLPIQTAVPAPTISAEMLDRRETPIVAAAVLVSQIDCNPWQSRIGDDPEHVLKIAEDIKARALADPGDPQSGILQVPIARPIPGGRYQLAFGHTRLAAFKHLANSEPDGERWEWFPLNVRQLTDRDMAEMAARENAARKDLTAIETARAMQRLISDFALTQLDAGKIFGYSSQGAVSNLLRLLELPEKVQDLVQRGVLPERLARQLIPVTRFDAARAETMASNLAGMPDDRYRDTRCENMVLDFYGSAGKSLQYAPFDLAWPKKPIQTPDELRTKKTPAELRACNGCEFKIKGKYSGDVCMCPPCFIAKTKLKGTREAERVSKALEIPTPAEGEKVTLVWSGTWENKDMAKALVESKHDSLRLVPALKHGYEAHNNQEVLGSEYVALATVDMDALKQDVKAVKKDQDKKNEPTWQEQQAETKRQHAEVVRLATRAAWFFKHTMPENTDLLTELYNVLVERLYMEGFERDKDGFHQGPMGFKQEMVARLLMLKHYWLDNNHDRGVATFAKWVTQFAVQLKVFLPADWDIPPQASTSDDQVKPKTKRGKK
jgi:ParB/RepB/Spo0J family partition protein